MATVAGQDEIQELLVKLSKGIAWTQEDESKWNKLMQDGPPWAKEVARKQLFENILANLDKKIELGSELTAAIKLADTDSTKAPETFANYSDQLEDIFAKFANTPQYANNRLKDEITKAIGDGAQLYEAISNIGTARGQIRQADEAAEALVEPAVPGITPKSTELAEATESARKRLSGPIAEIDPILQRNLDLLQKNLGVAKTASAGQAGAYGALGQQAINQARRGAMAAIPEIGRIKRGDEAAYRDLLRQGTAEDRNRFNQQMQAYDALNRRYLTEAEAAGNLGAAGRENLAYGRRAMTDQLGRTVAPLAVSGKTGVENILNNIRGRRATENELLNQTAPIGEPPKSYTALESLDPTAASYGMGIHESLGQYFPGRRVKF